jgi:hypothetical protein
MPGGHVRHARLSIDGGADSENNPDFGFILNAFMLSAHPKSILNHRPRGSESLT